MPKQVMRREASDNVYLHKDFHGALSVALDYLYENFGAQSVRRFIHQFAKEYYSGLTRDLITRGLPAMKEHYEKIYSIEGEPVETELTPDELTIKIKRCPAVTHIKKLGFKPANLFFETTRALNEAICENTQFSFELLEYDEETGRSIEHFYRREK